jgi:hypothetical protein
MNFKDLHIGHLIHQRITESGIEISRICNFMKCPEEEVEQTYTQENIPTDILLKRSKLLEYDLFRLYTQHLILYAPQGNTNYNSLPKKKKSDLSKLRKNIYAKEAIDFILEQINTGKMNRIQVMERYRIPKTTLYKWIGKYRR